MTCQRCGEYGEKWMLVGGYHAVLCREHRNAWHEYANAQEAFLTWRNLQSQREVLFAELHGGSQRIGVIGELIVEIAETVRRQEMAVYALAKAWVEAPQEDHTAEAGGSRKGAV